MKKARKQNTKKTRGGDAASKRNKKTLDVRTNRDLQQLGGNGW